MRVNTRKVDLEIDRRTYRNVDRLRVWCKHAEDQWTSVSVEVAPSYLGRAVQVTASGGNFLLVDRAQRHLEVLAMAVEVAEQLDMWMIGGVEDLDVLERMLKDAWEIENG